jgi:predicted dithiol-disulfide oxidoreductase (DUF899 family)
MMSTSPNPSAPSLALENHPVVTRAAWLEARKALLEKEKSALRAHDALMEERRALPWVKVEKDYAFVTPDGRKTLGELFEGRSQLIIYHFMLGPDWEEGCSGCSFLVDHIDGPLVHLNHHDVSVTVVSRAPLEEILRFKSRMGWKFPWVSACETDFNFDYHVSASQDDKARGKMVYNFEEADLEVDELPGVSVFYKDPGGTVYHTYSSYSRGPEPLIGAYSFLDLTPKGRNENGPHFNLGDWVKHHDRYTDMPEAGTSCCGGSP